jgi:pyridoxamine 5'-phosphate oxidase
MSAMEDTTLPAARRLAMMRRAYTLRGLSEGDLAPTWSAMFARWLDDAETGGILEPNAMVVATADADGRPNVRSVLLKGLDETSLTFFTNYTSAKGRELEANPVAAVLFPWVDLQRQVKLVGRVARLDPAASDAYFASRPHGSRLGALASPQSQVIADRAQLEAARDTLAARYPDQVPRPEHWGGYVVTPDTVEFWQGRPDRLHDRLVYRRQPDGTWITQRLAP